MTTRRNANRSDSWAALADLMAVISFSFLLLLGVAVLSAGTLLLVAKAQSLSARISMYEVSQLMAELEKLETARAVQGVLDRSRNALINELVQEHDGERAVFRLDDLGAGVKLDADILFDLGDFDLRRTADVEALLDVARRRLCRALELYQETYVPPEGAGELKYPFRYLEVSFEGHADRSQGGDLSNWALSSRRATTLLEAFVVPEDDAEPPDPTAVCRSANGGAAHRLESKVIRVVAAGRGAMDAGSCDEEVCAADRYALLRITVRMDRVFRDLGLEGSPGIAPGTLNSDDEPEQEMEGL